MTAISVDHVTKEFQLGQNTSLRETLGNAVARLRGAAPGAKPRFKALDDVSFDVPEGEVLGIIGANGAGKSTLLKLFARITTPTSGRVRVRGKTAPLIEVSAGLISDLTGRENVYLNGIILGMSYAETRRRFDEIVAFAELEEFIDTPVKRYSSGMVVRLGFSIATCMDADILIVDEVLAVGDLAFQRKCFDRMEDMIKRQGKTVVLVSHNTRQVERLCDRVILMDHGRVIADDVPKRVCDLFYERSEEKVKLASRGGAKGWANTLLIDDLEVLDVELLDATGKPTDVIPYKHDHAIRVRFIAHRELKVPVFGAGVHTPDFIYLARHNSEHHFRTDRLSAGKYEVICKIRQCPLLPGVYSLLLGIAEGPEATMIFYAENVVHFQVTSGAESLSSGHRDGFIALDATWAAPTPIHTSQTIAQTV
jgi:ABC-type polysaccharide/polyol phosphate transport system ATPase subunit